MAQRFDNVKLEKGMYHEAGKSFGAGETGPQRAV